jgi:hypothetical protein
MNSSYQKHLKIKLQLKKTIEKLTIEKFTLVTKNH